MQVKVFDTNAVEVGNVKLNDNVFKREYNEALIHQVVVAQMANARQGTKSALTRSEVRGGGAKPWRQKGTGRARQGSIRSPQWKKGGIVFAPKPRDFSKKVNKKARAAAFCSAISYKAANNELIVLDKIELTEGKTKLMAKILDNFKLTGKTLLVIENNNDFIQRASKNIDTLTVTVADLANVYQLVSNMTVIATKQALKQIEEVYA